MSPALSHETSSKVSVKSLDDLIRQLREIFDNDHVNVELVEALMAEYKSNPAEWNKFAKFDPSRHTRNLVDEGNGKYNLMVVCWGGGHGSTIHDHSDSHCFMKMLQGELNEIRFAWPNTKGDDKTKGTSLNEMDRFRLGSEGVSYINDSIGLHRIENASPTEHAVSLHLYCPPFSECSMFDQKTGRRVKCQITFWSKYGEKTSQGAPTPLACSVPTAAKN